jgi:hypothetical protein
MPEVETPNSTRGLYVTLMALLLVSAALAILLVRPKGELAPRRGALPLDLDVPAKATVP